MELTSPSEASDVSAIITSEASLITTIMSLKSCDDLLLVPEEI